MTLDQCVKRLIIKSPFYGLFILGLNRRFDDKCPTACVARNGINTELLVNKDFWESLNDEMQISILCHEVEHLLFGHVFMAESFGNHNLFNMAADEECNSYLPALQKDPYCYPKAFGHPDKQGTKWYYSELSKQQKENPQNGNGSGQSNNDSGQNQQGRQTVDDHSSWKEFKDLSDAEKELVKQQIDHQAKQVAEQVQKMAGSIPGEFKDYIDSLFKQKPAVFNWKAYFRRMLGVIMDITLKKTYKKESNRFHNCAGIRKKKKVAIMVAIDTSGSVSDQELCDFFSEINHIYKSGAIIRIVEFDHGLQRQYDYKGKWDGTISGRGGTEFSMPINLYNQHRKDYSALVMFTDGYAPINNLNPQGPVIWIITSDGSKQNYPGKTIYIPKNNE